MIDRRADIELELERFIVDHLLDELRDGRDPLAAKAVDSLGIEQLVDYIEEEFDVELGDEDLIEENFESIPVLARLVEARRRGPR